MPNLKDLCVLQIDRIGKLKQREITVSLSCFDYKMDAVFILPDFSAGLKSVHYKIEQE